MLDISNIITKIITDYEIRIKYTHSHNLLFQKNGRSSFYIHIYKFYIVSYFRIETGKCPKVHV